MNHRVVAIVLYVLAMICALITIAPVDVSIDPNRAYAAGTLIGKLLMAGITVVLFACAHRAGRRVKTTQSTH